MLREELERYSKEIESYLATSISIAIVQLDLCLNIVDCNLGFMRLFNVRQHPAGEPLHNYFALDASELQVGEELKLPCSSESGVSGVVYCNIIRKENGYLMFCGRLLITESRALKQIGSMNDELINLQRELVKKNHLLEKLKMDLDERVSELESANSEQRQLVEQIRKMSRGLEQSPAAIVITNIEGVIEYVNPKFIQTTGYTAEEAIGQNPRVLKSGEMSADDYTELWKRITSGKEWRGEFHNRRKDGTLYWEFASISPLLNKEGEITGYLAVKEDITKRKAIEAELVKSRLELEAKHGELEQLFGQVEHAKREWEQTLDHLRDFVVLTDADYRIRRCNKLLSDATGKPIDELVGADWYELINDAGFKFVTLNDATGEVFNPVSGRYYDISIYSIEDNAVVTGYVISLNDTTDVRATTQELEKAYRELKDAQLQIFQQEKMASIGQLAAGVAHEINNPMGFISSNLSTLNKYIDRLAEFIAAGDDRLFLASYGGQEAEKLNKVRKQLKIDYIMDDARQLIAESQDGAGRVRRIVQDLKSFSRVDQAESAFINLNEAIETTINIAWNEIKYVATINKEFGDIPHVKCYPQQLNQVFLNLLLNAAHALGENQGVITVRTWSEKEDVFVSVSDSGCGITDEIRQKIFEPFFTTKEVGKGTGLGLSISYDIIRKHGGEITFESEVGKRTTFIVRLPLDAAAGGYVTK
jgi:two-component system NtrC family sensor kinase